MLQSKAALISMLTSIKLSNQQQKCPSLGHCINQQWKGLSNGLKCFRTVYCINSTIISSVGTLTWHSETLPLRHKLRLPAGLRVSASRLGYQ